MTIDDWALIGFVIASVWFFALMISTNGANER